VFFPIVKTDTQTQRPYGM